MNKVTLIGRLSKDPELRYTPGEKSTAICRFSMAVNREFKKGECDFINCIAFGKTGETIAQYLTKGNQFAVSGRIQTGSYTNNSGGKVYTTDVVVESFDFINGSSNNNTNNNNNQQQNDSFGGGFYDNITPVDDGDMPF